jgi:hypothetical protein
MVLKQRLSKRRAGDRKRNLRWALQKAEVADLLSFDPEYLERQEIWQKARFAGLVDLSHPWSSGSPSTES